MMPWRLGRAWHRLPFSVRFASIIALTGLVIASATLILARSQAQTGAMSRASDRLDVAQSLISDRRGRIQSVSDQLAVIVARNNGALSAQLLDASRVATNEVVGVVGTTNLLVEN